MTFSLDSIIDNTIASNGNSDSGAKVVMENHDANPSSCASLDSTTGRVALATVGQSFEWHGTGTVLDRNMTSAEGMEYGGLNYPISKQASRYEWNGQPMVDLNRFKIIREDTGAALGDVGKEYNVLQNAEMFAHMDNLLGKHGAHYQAVGALDGGRKVWITAQFDRPIEPVAGDKIFTYLMLTGSHDGSGATALTLTDMRAVCKNTYTAALRTGKKAWSYRHSTNQRSYMRDAEKAFAAIEQQREATANKYKQLVETPCDVQQFSNDILDDVLDITAAQCAVGSEKLAVDALSSVLDVTQKQIDIEARKFERRIKRREGLLEDILNRHESETCEAARGSAWAAWNAYTEAVDHGNVFRYRGSENRNEKHFKNIMFGNANTSKADALEKALAIDPATGRTVAVNV